MSRWDLWDWAFAFALLAFVLVGLTISGAALRMAYR